MAYKLIIFIKKKEYIYIYIYKLVKKLLNQVILIYIYNKNKRTYIYIIEYILYLS